MNTENKMLIAECTTYDFKVQLERRKVRSWLKSVSAFANTQGGSLYFGIDNDGKVVGVEDAQSDSEFISEKIKALLDPIPTFEIVPHEVDGKRLIEVSVKSGTLTPYYYYHDGARTAYVRVGNESVECNSQQLLSLVLKGSHMTWDSLPTAIEVEQHSFIMLANAFRKQTNQEWNSKYLESFGLVTVDRKLTNAGMLFVDDCPVFQSRIFCTRWNGVFKDDAIDSIEHRANLILLLKYGMDFITNHTMHGWVKMPTYRLDIPDYAERAIFEGLVNHLIHRDYTFMGAEVHIDIYDDRIEMVSPGAMLDGSQIQERDIYNVPSMRRNPIIADMFAQLDYMEKRGSGLRKMIELTEKLPNHGGDKLLSYRTEGGYFYTIFHNQNWGQEGRQSVEEIEKRLKNDGVNDKNVGVNVGVNDKNVGVNVGINGKNVGITAQRIIDAVIADASITHGKIAEKLGVSVRTVERQIQNLRNQGIVTREGSDKTGYWRITLP